MLTRLPPPRPVAVASLVALLLGAGFVGAHPYHLSDEPGRHEGPIEPPIPDPCLMSRPSIDSGDAQQAAAADAAMARVRAACGPSVPTAPDPDRRCDLPRAERPGVPCPELVLPTGLKNCITVWSDASATFNRRGVTTPPNPVGNPGERGLMANPNPGSAIGFPTEDAADAARCALEHNWPLSRVVEEVVYNFGNAGLAQLVFFAISNRGQQSRSIVRDAVMLGAERRFIERQIALSLEAQPAAGWREAVLEPIDPGLIDYGERMAGVVGLLPNDDPGGSASAN